MLFTVLSNILRFLLSLCNFYFVLHCLFACRLFVSRLTCLFCEVVNYCCLYEWPMNSISRHSFQPTPASPCASVDAVYFHSKMNSWGCS